MIPSPPAPHAHTSLTPSGGLKIRNTTLKNLVRSAYQLNANIPAGVPRDQIPLMMQTAGGSGDRPRRETRE